VTYKLPPFSTEDILLIVAFAALFFFFRKKFFGRHFLIFKYEDTSGWGRRTLKAVLGVDLDWWRLRNHFRIENQGYTYRGDSLDFDTLIWPHSIL
jgi:hypothetical protein